MSAGVIRAPDHGNALLRVTGMSAGYGAGAVLRDVTFHAEPGQRIAILGPNGGGKTTLFRVLLGELTPLTGTIELDVRCGLVPQTERSRLDFPVSALDVALMGTISTLPWWRRPGRAERTRARAALADVGLADRADFSFGALSGGQRQRVLIARALVQDSQVVLLDEPFAGLDNRSEEQLERLFEHLASEGRALLIATHDVQQAEAWDRVLSLNGRQVAFGCGEDVLTEETLRATYGEELVTLPGGILQAPHNHCHGDDDHSHSHGARQHASGDA